MGRHIKATAIKNVKSRVIRECAPLLTFAYSCVILKVGNEIHLKGNAK